MNRTMFSVLTCLAAAALLANSTAVQARQTILALKVESVSDDSIVLNGTKYRLVGDGGTVTIQKGEVMFNNLPKFANEPILAACPPGDVKKYVMPGDVVNIESGGMMDVLTIFIHKK